MNDTHPRERLRVTSPGDELLGCDEVHVGQGEDRVNELEETLLPVGPVEEPGSVEEEGEGGLALGVVLQEVLSEDLLDGVGVLIVETPVRHRAGSPPGEFKIIDIFCDFDKNWTMTYLPLKRPKSDGREIEVSFLCVKTAFNAISLLVGLQR